MSHRVSLILLVAVLFSNLQAQETDLVIDMASYTTAGLFTTPLLPHEYEPVEITIRLSGTALRPQKPSVLIEIVGPDQNVVTRQHLILTNYETTAEGSLTWAAGRNGLYQILVWIDPDNQIEEASEANNAAQLILPVLKTGIVLHLPWQYEMPWIRWATCIGSANAAPQRVRLNERGINGLHWEYAGASWNYYERDREDNDRQALLDEIEQIFYSKFIATNDLVGYGLDETICEPTPQEIMCQKSIASMKGLLRARSVVPDRFYLVWHAGTIHEELAQYLRPAADLVALEKYVCRDISEKGLAHAFSVIDREVENLRRLGHLIEPGKGQICHTVLAFDTSERPDLVGPNDMEQVVRYLRQVCPQMRGLGWYNGGYGSYLLKQKDLTAVTDDRHEQAVRTADRLNFEYFIKPCVTLEQNSLKVSQDTQNGQSEFAVALRNIGGMDSGPVEMEMFADGESVGRKTVASVPAGPTAKQNGLVVRQAVEVQKDASRFEVKIRRAPGSTVLNARVVL